MARGFQALKFGPIDTTLLVDIPSPIWRASEVVAAVRETLGPDLAIAVDANRRLRPAMAIELAHAIEPFDVWFVEEPAAYDNPRRLLQVASG